jgi:SAM-dependent methyltransferase
VPGWVAPEIDITKPSIARVYDYVLGGKDHYEIDRKAAQAFIDAVPESPELALANRLFVRRGVRHLVREAGIRQIIDIGSGLPTAGNVHEIAHATHPDVRVVYVDNDPIVLAHGRALLAENDRTTVIQADLHDPESIFSHPETRALIRTDEPFAVLLGGILHHLHDADDPWRLTADIRSRIPAGGYLLIANFARTGDPRAEELERAFIDGGLGTGRFRTRDEQLRFFGDMELVPPGLVQANDWHPDSETPSESPVHDLYLGAIGRRR